MINNCNKVTTNCLHDFLYVKYFKYGVKSIHEANLYVEELKLIFHFGSKLQFQNKNKIAVKEAFYNHHSAIWITPKSCYLAILPTTW